MEIEKNHPLKDYNTFGIEAYATEFVAVHTIDELKQVLQQNKGKKLFVLGGGSNMLLTKNIDALVIKVSLKGIQTVWQDDTTIHVEAMAGENWNEFVNYCINNNYGGIENLSLIPGNIGATPIQNIGAYGKEIKDVFVQCEAIDVATQQLKTFNAEQCKFGYRESIFKGELKGRYIITSVTFSLTKQQHIINTAYGDIAAELSKNNISVPTIKDVGAAVTAIRRAKLPDPAVLGNSGSFFKNPVVTAAQFEELYIKHPQIPHYPAGETHVKVPAGWLIEQCGFKGSRIGDAGVHAKQALVLVNYGNATGKEIFALSQKIQQAVKVTFGIAIEAEVNII